MTEDAALLDITFTGVVIEWRGPPPFNFVALPDDEVAGIREAARMASYGWGVVPVVAAIGGTHFATSLFPRNGGYLLPLKEKVRRAADVVLGEMVDVALRVEPRSKPGRGAQKDR
jgi:hypothetical protein